MPSSRPESLITDQRSAFSYKKSSIEPPYKLAQKQLKVSIAQFPQGFLKMFRVQHEALTVRRPQHPGLACRTTILHGEIFSRLVPRDPNLEHYSTYF